MLGLPVFYGSPVSNYAESNIELTGIGTLLAVSRQPGLNELACTYYADEFGRDHVYIVGNSAETSHEKHKVSGAIGGRVLFDSAHTIDALFSQLATGATVKTTELSGEFDLAAYQQEHPTSLPIFAIDEDGQLRFPVHDEKFDPRDGWRVTALVEPVAV